jgi:hypothetical protein
MTQIFATPERPIGPPPGGPAERPVRVPVRLPTPVIRTDHMVTLDVTGSEVVIGPN